MPGREDVFQKAMSEGHSAAWDQQWEKAAAAYRKALEEMPAQPKALTSLGLALFQLQNYPDSLRAYQQAAEAAKNGCPISSALKIAMSVKAALQG